MNEPETFKMTSPKSDVIYHKYTCSKCGKESKNTYCEPYRTLMLERRLCYMCNHWVEFEEELEKTHTAKTIIDGHVYSPGNRTSGSFRGMAGRRFDIEYISPSDHCGKKITTFDLWSGSTLPDNLREKYADTAKFLDGAERVKVGETTCFNPSDNKNAPYPLPSTLKKNI
jgi:hypothetical protein